jgi:hypothetical protein
VAGGEDKKLRFPDVVVSNKQEQLNKQRLKEVVEQRLQCSQVGHEVSHKHTSESVYNTGAVTLLGCSQWVRLLLAPFYGQKSFGPACAVKQTMEKVRERWHERGMVDTIERRASPMA